MSPLNVVLIARKEVRDAVRNRWFLLYTAVFTILALALAFLSLAGASAQGHVGFGRTTAGLVNLVCLVVPLMALNVGAASVAGERERGTLDYLLSQPVDRAEVLLGKYFGLAFVLMAALAGGFGVSAAAMAATGGGARAGSFAALVIFSWVLGLGMLAVGVLVSCLCPRASVAAGVAVALWLGLVFLSDLGLIGSSMLLKLDVTRLFHVSLLNPLQVFKIAVLSRLHATLDVLGPAGLYATQTYGRGLIWILCGALTGWVLIPLAGALAIFTRVSRP
jgi:Cu-processing system permease protein